MEIQKHIIKHGGSSVMVQDDYPMEWPSQSLEFRGSGLNSVFTVCSKTLQCAN